MKKVDFIWICIALLSGLFIYTTSKWVYPDIAVELSVERPTQVEVFVKVGKAFHPDHSVSFGTPNGSQYNTYASPLYYDNISAIRLDPSRFPGGFSIRSLKLGTGAGSTVLYGKELLDHVGNTNNVNQLVVNEGILTGMAIGNDPYMEITTSSFSKVQQSTGFRILLSLLIAFCIYVFLYLFSRNTGSLLLSIFGLLFVSVIGDRWWHSFDFFTIYQVFNFGIAGKVVLSACFGLLVSKFLRQRKEVYDDKRKLLRSFFPASIILFIGLSLAAEYKWLFASLSLLVVVFWGAPLTSNIQGFVRGLVDDGEGKPARSSALAKLMLFSSIIFLIIQRTPTLFVDPRIWAEDGTHTFINLYHAQSWLDLFYYHEYYRVLSSVAGILATQIFALEQAAFVFTFVSFLVMLVPFLVVITGQSSLWNTLPKKILACLIILYAPASAEVWLNVNGSHFYMTLIAALLFAEIDKPQGKVHSFLTFFLLGTASLSGVLPCMLTPLYWLKALIKRNKRTLIAAAIITGGTIIQLVLIVLYEGDTPPRSSLPTISIAGWVIFIKTILLPLNEYWAGWGFRQSRIAPEYVGQLLLGGYFFLIVLLCWVLRKSSAFYLLLGSTVIIICALLFAIGGENQGALRHPLIGNRYFYAPNTLILLSIVGVIQQLGRRFGSYGVSLASAVLVLLSSFVLSNNMALFYKERVVLSHLPRWSSEIKLFRENPGHKVKIWPKGWVIDLSPKN